MIATGRITGNACSFSFAFKYLSYIVVGATFCWVLGGLAAMVWAGVDPGTYRALIVSVPDEFGEMLAFAWVGGSIWGAQIGGFVSVVLALVFLRAAWQRRELEA